MIQRVEKQRQVTGGIGVIRVIAANASKPNAAGIGNLEQITTVYTTRNIGKGRRDPKDNKASRYCSHYKRSGHNIDQCFKVVGYLEWCKGARDTTKGTSSMRVSANMVGQEVGDNSLQETSNYKDISYSG